MIWFFCNLFGSKSWPECSWKSFSPLASTIWLLIQNNMDIIKPSLCILPNLSNLANQAKPRLT